MSRALLLLLLSLSALAGNAQSWCPPGATWTFGYTDVLNGYYGVQRVEYIGDTMVGGQLAQRLKETEVIAQWGTADYISSSYSSIYTYHDSGVVYTWNGFDSYDTLMWFNAAPGQRWYAPEGSSMYLQVLDTATVVMDGVPLKRLIVQGDMEWLTDTLYERIGFLGLYLAGWSWGATDMPWTGLICYQDDGFSFTASAVGDCGFTLPVEEQLAGASLLPCPNPGTDHFNLSLLPGPHIVTVFDATGRMAHQQRTPDALATIKTAHLPSGIYVVKVDEGLQPLRWMKE